MSIISNTAIKYDYYVEGVDVRCCVGDDVTLCFTSPATTIVFSPAVVAWTTETAAASTVIARATETATAARETGEESRERAATAVQACRTTTAPPATSYMDRQEGD